MTNRTSCRSIVPYRRASALSSYALTYVALKAEALASARPSASVSKGVTETTGPKISCYYYYYYCYYYCYYYYYYYYCYCLDYY